ncbi:hypothetical protein FACS189413_13140 [Bacteroidia bacterium]|nr:hypothetical protein FACS189413_13140 [Bacteroidia bacterium]
MKNIFISVFLLTFCVSASAVDFAGGEGTPTNPYKIATAAQVNEIRNNMTSHFILLNDIDLSSDYPSWTPIGKTTPYFSGVLNGDGHVISGISITSASGNYTGFFGVLAGTVKNLGVKGSVTATTVANGGGAGLLAGYLGQAVPATSTIENCFAEGTVVANIGTAGGAALIVGTIAQAHAVVRNCYSKGSVTNTGAPYTGGIAGRTTAVNATVTNCYSEATVTGQMYVGGIIGQLRGDNISNCYASGAVSGTDYVGGVIGNAYNDADKKATGFVALNPSVTATTGSNVGQVCGAIGAGITADKLYGLETTTVILNGEAQSITSNATGKDGATTALTTLLSQIFYKTTLGWDFDNIWAIREGKKIPYFQWQEADYAAVYATEPFTIGANVAKSAVEYATQGKYGNIVINSDGTNTGQLTGITGDLTVSGTISLVKPFEPKKWYTIGFPIEFGTVTATATGGIFNAGYGALEVHNGIEGVGSHGDFWLKTVNSDAEGFTVATTLDAGKGYIIQFPDDFEDIPVTFTSDANITLSANSTELPAGDNAGYALIANPGLSGVTDRSEDFKGHYQYDFTNQRFDVETGTEISVSLKPFEALLVAHSDVSVLKSSVSSEDSDAVTGLNVADANDPVIETRYYNLQGVAVGALRATPLQPGIYIVKQIHESGKSEVSKIIK